MPTPVPAGHPGFDLATPLPRCRACVRRSAPRGDRATCGSGTGSPRPARSVDIRPPTRGATSAPARCDLQTPGPRQAPPNAPYARHESRCAGHTARSAEAMRDTAGAVSRAPMSVGIPMPARVPAGHTKWRSPVTPTVERRPRGHGGKGLPPYGLVGLKPVPTSVPGYLANFGVTPADSVERTCVDARMLGRARQAAYRAGRWRRTDRCETTLT
jgi:hypothetical protein